jgi:hypothetical protein
MACPLFNLKEREMHLYNCKVRLSGSLYNEVPKTKITAAEIDVLRILHGDDAVADIEKSGNDPKLTDVGVKDHLHRVYGEALRKRENDRSILEIFGRRAPLPKSLSQLEAEPEEKPKRVPVKRKPVPKAAKPEPAPASEDDFLQEAV